MTPRTIEIEVIKQGLVEILGDKKAYLVIGNDEIIGFYVDTNIRAWVTASSTHDDGCPIVWICHDVNQLDEINTCIGFPEFKGYSVHSTRGGKSLAIALVNDNVFK